VGADLINLFSTQRVGRGKIILYSKNLKKELFKNSRQNDSGGGRPTGKVTPPRTYQMREIQHPLCSRPRIQSIRNRTSTSRPPRLLTGSPVVEIGHLLLKLNNPLAPRMHIELEQKGCVKVHDAVAQQETAHPIGVEKIRPQVEQQDSKQYILV